MRQFLRTAALVALIGLPAFAQVHTWQIDPAHTRAQSSVRHLGISTVRGDFSNVTGAAKLDEKDITHSQIEVVVDATTFNTGVPDRDKDIKSPNFLDVEKYPTMAFKSEKITSAGDDKLKLTGDLTIHGVTKEVTFDVDGPSPSIKDPWGNLRRGASATAKINRKDFGITWNKTLDSGGLVVSDEVTITIDIELTRKP